MKILIPVDFSKVSANTIRFAWDACANKDQITILHVSQGVLSSAEYYNPGLGNLNLEPVLKNKLKELIKSALSLENIPPNFETEVLIGDAVSEIQYFAEKNNFDEIYVGSRDKSDLIDKWIGTISLGVVKTNKVPVYLIPINCSYDGFKKVMVATDKKLQDPSILSTISSWNKEHRAFMSFLQVYNASEEKEDSTTEEIVRAFYEKQEVDFGFEIRSMGSSDISGSLLEQAYSEAADLMIAVPENHGFFHTLMFRSISKDLVLKSKIPVLFLHK